MISRKSVRFAIFRRNGVGLIPRNGLVSGKNGMGISLYLRSFRGMVMVCGFAADCSYCFLCSPIVRAVHFEDIGRGKMRAGAIAHIEVIRGLASFDGKHGRARTRRAIRHEGLSKLAWKGQLSFCGRLGNGVEQSGKNGLPQTPIEDRQCQFPLCIAFNVPIWKCCNSCLHQATTVQLVQQL